MTSKEIVAIDSGQYVTVLDQIASGGANLPRRFKVQPVFPSLNTASTDEVFITPGFKPIFDSNTHPRPLEFTDKEFQSFRKMYIFSNTVNGDAIVLPLNYLAEFPDLLKNVFTGSKVIQFAPTSEEMLEEALLESIVKYFSPVTISSKRKYSINLHVNNISAGKPSLPSSDETDLAELLS